MVDRERQAHEVDRNYDAFVRLLATLLPEHRDQWAPMHDARIVSIFPDVGTAYDQSRAAYGKQGFLIQEITDEPIDLGFWSHVAAH